MHVCVHIWTVGWECSLPLHRLLTTPSRLLNQALQSNASWKPTAVNLERNCAAVSSLKQRTMHILLGISWNFHMGISIKWMVYIGKSYWNMDRFWVPSFWETSKCKFFGTVVPSIFLREEPRSGLKPRSEREKERSFPWRAASGLCWNNGNGTTMEIPNSFPCSIFDWIDWGDLFCNRDLSLVSHLISFDASVRRQARRMQKVADLGGVVCWIVNAMLRCFAQHQGVASPTSKARSNSLRSALISTLVMISCVFQLPKRKDTISWWYQL